MSYDTLLIDSTFRNRNKFKSPFKFDIKAKYVTGFDKKKVGDPVSEQAPVISWSPLDMTSPTLTIEVISCLSYNNYLVELNTLLEVRPNYFKGLQIEYTNTTSGDTIRNTIVGSKQRATNATNGTTIIEIFLKDDNKSVGNRVNVGDTFDLPSPPSSRLSPLVLPSFFDRPRKYMFIPGNNLLGTHLDSYIITNDSQTNISFNSSIRQ